MHWWLLTGGIVFIVSQTALIVGLLINRKKRQKAEEALLDERNMLYSLMDNLHEAVYFKDRNSKFIRGNVIDARLHGFPTPEDLIGKDDFDIHEPKLARHFYTEEQEMMRTDTTIVDQEEMIKAPNGEDRWVRYSKVPVKNRAGEVIGLFGLAQDITEKKRTEKIMRDYHEKLRQEVYEKTDELAEKNKALQEQLKERDVLLHEIHHRVNNNLQIIISLMNLQFENVDSGNIEPYVKKTLGRIQSMALVHLLLYREKNFTTINPADIVRELTHSVSAQYDNNRIRFNIDINSTSRIDIQTAVPLGLVLNEVLSHVFQHLSSPGGEIDISLNNHDGRLQEITISDNGPESGPLDKLSENLVENLLDQIDGLFSYSYTGENIRRITL